MRDPRLVFLPFVDGTFGAKLSDGDDWQVLEGGTRASLWKPLWKMTEVCGNVTYWPYP